MIVCKLCNIKLKDRRTFSFHLTRIHKNSFDSKLDREKYLIESIYPIDLIKKTVGEYTAGNYPIYKLPIDIGKYIDLLGLKRTSSEERLTDRYKSEFKSTILDKYGVEYVSQIDSVKEKVKLTNSSKYGSYENYIIKKQEELSRGYGEYCLDEKKQFKARSKFIATCISKYGVENVSQIPEIRIVNSKHQKEYNDNLSYEQKLKNTENARAAVCSRGGYSSKIEKKIQKVLIDLDVEFKCNKMLFGYNWDVILSNNILIEVQGIMWHAKPTLYCETDLIMGKLLVKDIWDKDKRKRYKAEQNGYIVIEIWEDEINSKSTLELSQYVKELLTDHGYEFL